MSEKPPADRQAEVLDVQLLDVLAQVEAVLRHGREIQREALRVRGVPSPVNERQRVAAALAIGKRIDDMHGDCASLCTVVEELRGAARELQRLLTPR